MKKKSLTALIAPLKEIDFATLGLLTGLFLMIGGISAEGVIDAAAGLLAKAGGGNVFLLYTLGYYLLTSLFEGWAMTAYAKEVSKNQQ